MTSIVLAVALVVLVAIVWAIPDLLLDAAAQLDAAERRDQ